MRTLKYAILGLLNRHPMTGYDIGKAFNHELSQFWSANHSQIYPELKALEKEGLVCHDIQISGEILEKKNYSITEEGKKDFLIWLHKDKPMEKTPKDVFRLRMYFCNDLDVESRIHLFESQLQQHNKLLASLCKTMEQYQVVPALDTDRFGDFIVLESAILRERYYIQWINNCIWYCKNAGQKSDLKPLCLQMDTL